VLALFGAAIFLGAFLIFVLQPVAAKMVLPSLGGSPAVWNTCMVFFQGALLAGYAYAHWATRLLPARRLAVVHAALVLAPVLTLPVALRAGAPPVSGSPVAWLLAALALSVGLPFTVASTGAPLLQRWFASTGHPAARDPYFLYAASNAGSLLALLAYPGVLEPLTTLAQQRWLWSGGYVLMALLTVGCALAAFRHGPGGAPGTAGPQRDAGAPAKGASDARPGVEGPAPAAAPGWRERAAWVALAFVPSTLMLGVTQFLSTDVAAVPLLWVVPLALYLLTFILAFARRPLAPVRPLSRILAILAVGLAVSLIVGAKRPAWTVTLLHLATFFTGALLCHGRLAACRPHPSRLTEFYLLIAVGGVLGGMFNALAGPALFDSVAEYPIALGLVCLARLPRTRRPPAEGMDRAPAPTGRRARPVPRRWRGPRAAGRPLVGRCGARPGARGHAPGPGPAPELAGEPLPGAPRGREGRDPGPGADIRSGRAAPGRRRPRRDLLHVRGAPPAGRRVGSCTRSGRSTASTGWPTTVGRCRSCTARPSTGRSSRTPPGGAHP
jgi:hypothetical protein